ncbi:hypothetical protein OG579_08550 [Williamsia herbipolensis]|uniref:Uncharacterized protein n=1 Tax=Williamsia herbipolensis TaxID=1603258 RepID=A0AAU4K799_9NOCA|nr:hypothetical protein [Williamsia herbipolensis]
MARIIGDIDDRIRRGDLPADILTFEDAVSRSTEQFACVDVLSDVDRDAVIAGVDEVLRIRAGGVY